MIEGLGWALISVFLITVALPILGALALIWSALRIKPRPAGTRRFVTMLAALVVIYVVSSLLFRGSGYDNVLAQLLGSVAFIMLVGIYLFVPPEDPLRGLRFIDTFLVAIALGLAASASVLGAGAPEWWVLVAFPAAQLAIVLYYLVLRAYVRGVEAGS